MAIPPPSDDPARRPSRAPLPFDEDDPLAREVPLEVMQRLGGALSPAEMVEASQGVGALLPRLLLRAYLESARISLARGETQKALEELQEVQRLLKEVGGAGEAREASELKKDVERSIVARSTSPDNAFLVFAELNEIIQSRISVGEKMGQVLTRVAEAVDAERGFWATYDASRGELSVTATTELAADEAAGLLQGLCVGGQHLLGSGGPIISVGVATDERFRFDPRLGEIDSLILVPCRAGGELSGMVYFDRLVGAGHRSFTQTDLDLVTALAGSLAIVAVEAHLGLEVRANVDLRRQLSEKYSWHNVVTRNKPMMEVLRVLERISSSNMTVLLQGETGTGKRLLAQAIHHHSPRRDRPFVTIDCAALSAQLLESELFGHMRGSFTGATADRKGLFEEAHGGTVFLDEIDKTTQELQRRLLHVVDQGEVRPLGAPEYRQVDARIVCATSHPDLRRAVDEGRFIKDLFYRLNDISVYLPPLRERKEDLTMLVEHFLQKACAEMGRAKPCPVSRAAMRLLLDYDWPGNVRELEKVMRRAVVLAEEGEEILPDSFPPELRGAAGSGRAPGAGLAAPGSEAGIPSSEVGAWGRGGSSAQDAAGPGALAERMQAVERRELLAALNQFGWNKSRAARALGLTRKGLRMKIVRYGLERQAAPET